MGVEDKPVWEQTGSSFIQNYYQLFDNDRIQLGAVYFNLPFQKTQHSITAQDHQPMLDSCIISTVEGQLKANEDPIMWFHQMVLLKSIKVAWICTNDMFRLALHNLG
uniref:NTF2 domain-containing protein n=1 Tax=Moschus moschiferus TaxID=68415 RepID=A0A8C6E060_MOSMO